MLSSCLGFDLIVIGRRRVGFGGDSLGLLLSALIVSAVLLSIIVVIETLLVV